MPAALSESSKVADTARIRTRLCSKRLYTERSHKQLNTTFDERERGICLSTTNLCQPWHAGPSVGQRRSQCFHKLVETPEEGHQPVLVPESLLSQTQA